MTGTKRSANAAYSAPIVSKAVRVLNAIVRAPKNMGISEIASTLSLAKSTTHGILTALEESGWVLRDPVSRKYTCGYVFRDLAGGAVVRLPFVELARPHLQELGDAVNEDVFLGILAAQRILILDQVESSQELKVAKRPGATISIFAGSAGRIFLAHQDRQWLRALLASRPLPAFTAKSITDSEQYLRALDEVQEAGIDMDCGEYIRDVWAVAVPIMHGTKSRRRMVAGFWVVGLDPAPSQEKMEYTMRLARATGATLSSVITEHGGTS